MPRGPGGGIGDDADQRPGSLCRADEGKSLSRDGACGVGPRPRRLAESPARRDSMGKCFVFVAALSGRALQPCWPLLPPGWSISIYYYFWMDPERRSSTLRPPRPSGASPLLRRSLKVSFAIKLIAPGALALATVSSSASIRRAWAVIVYRALRQGTGAQRPGGSGSEVGAGGFARPLAQVVSRVFDGRRGLRGRHS